MVVMPNMTPDLELLLEHFAHPLEPLDYMVIRQTPDSKSPLLASNSSKARICSSVAKRYRANLVEFLDLMRERADQFFVKIWGKERN